MATVRTIVSRIRSVNKLISSDNTINDRTVAQEAKSASRLLIKREIDKRKLFQSPTIFTTIPCLEMTDASLAECCDYISNKTIAKSKLQVPKIADANFGLILQGAFSVEGNRKLTYTTASRYENTLKLNLPDNKVYFWIMDNYVYLSDPTIKVIKLIAFFEEDVPDEVMYPECPCNTTPKDPCRNPLDEDFKCPGYLEDGVVDIVVNRLLKTYFNVPSDKADDNVDGQSKNNQGR